MQYFYDKETKTFYRRKNAHNKPELLGNIGTLKGRLTHEQKLKIIQSEGWIELYGK
jgi:hypothetical protein